MSISVPIVLVIFNRPDEVAKQYEILKEVSAEKIYIVSDGPRTEIKGEADLVSRSRDIFKAPTWPCEIVRLYSAENLGLKSNVTRGLDIVFQHEETAIILEDDCHPDQSFFRFCEELLDVYANSRSVALISGNYFGGARNRKVSYFFSPNAHIWGWATWRRTWIDFRNSGFLETFNANSLALLRRKAITPDKKILYAQMEHNFSDLNSWALPFSLFVSVNDLLVATPYRNLVTNSGFGSNSTHTKFESWADEVKVSKIEWQLRHPPQIRLSRISTIEEFVGKMMRLLYFPLRHPTDAFARLSRFLVSHRKA